MPDNIAQKAIGLIKRKISNLNEAACSRRYSRMIDFDGRERFERAFAEMKSVANYGYYSLAKNALMSFAKAVSQYDKPRIVEFGSGCSTLFHDRYFAGDAVVDSFEHETGFADFLNTKLRSGAVKIHRCPLWQFSDEEFGKIMSCEVPLADMYAMGKPLDESLYADTRTKNAFYKIDEIGDCYDAMIVDGPHGNGRAAAYAIMRDRLADPGVILIDDVNHYDFLYSCSQHFSFNVLHAEIYPVKRWTLLEAHRK